MSISYSWISLIIIALVILLLSLGQGQTILIDLLDHNSINLLLFYILTYGLAKVVSHYPEYIDIWHTSRKEPNRYFWKIDYTGFPTWSKSVFEWFKRIFGLGIITYGINKGVTKQWNPRYTVNNYIRRGLGLVVFCSILFVLFGTLQVNHILPTSWCRVLPWAFSLLFIIIHLFAQRNYTRWGLFHLRIVFLSSYILIATTLLISAWQGWSRETVIFFILSWAMCVLRFILFRAARKEHFTSDYWIDYLYRWRGHTSYVLRLSWYGITSILVVIYAHIFPQAINPLIIIIAYLNIVYGLIVLPIKGYLYHSYQNKIGLRPKRFYLYTIPLLPMLVAGVSLLGSRLDNNLHLLPNSAYSAKPDIITYNQFLTDAGQVFNDADPIYYIASYGGGLKANAWNLLVLSELGKQGVLDRTMVLSGVSGGSLGQHVYTALESEYNDLDKIINISKKISEANFLSVDAAHFLGLDYLREFIPDGILPYYPDRAIRSMNLYADYINPNSRDVVTTPYAEYWSALYQNRRSDNRFYPALISNSTGTHHERGIVSSIDFGHAFSDIFPASTDILFSPNDLTKSNHSIPFLYAASCTNRFPVFSPAAKVAEKGHFVDGGYFENSGLLSLMNLYDYIDKLDSTFNKGRSYIIQIVNDKPAYIRYMLDHWMEDASMNRSRIVKPQTELSAVLRTITSIDQMPRYVNERVKTTFGKRLIEVHLPYVFTIKDVEEIYEGEIDNTIILEKIRKHNLWIKTTLLKDNSPYDVAEPPLARLLGDEAFLYMEVLVSGVLEEALNKK